MADFDLSNFDTQVRIRIPSSDPLDSITLTANYTDRVETIPIKEWSIVDDVLTVSDCASFSIANIDGEHSGKFVPGQLVFIEEAHPQVAQGKWIKHFTGRITSVESYSDATSGSGIIVTCMDLGWHLMNCHGPTHRQIKGKKFAELVKLLIDPTWGIDTSKFSFDGNKMSRLRHGRQLIVQALQHVEGQILPYIQVDPGQSPYEILRLYAEREGLLINVDANGQLVFFRPDYSKQPIYELFFYGANDPNRTKNNIIGRPSIRESIDGIYSQVTCWSTVVQDDQLNTDDPNAAYTRTNFNPNPPGTQHPPLPFNRHHVITDGEAINAELRKNRAIMRYQMGQFESWEYTAEFPGHVQGPADNKGFYTSNELINIKDTVNGADGVYFVQSVQRSSTAGGGNKTRLTIRKSGLLNPLLGALKTKSQRRGLGGGARGKSSTPPENQSRALTPIYDSNGVQIGWR